MTERILCVILLSLTEIYVCIYHLQLFNILWVGEEEKETWCFYKYEQLFKQHIAVTSLIKTDTCS